MKLCTVLAVFKAFFIKREVLKSKINVKLIPRLSNLYRPTCVGECEQKLETNQVFFTQFIDYLLRSPFENTKNNNYIFLGYENQIFYGPLILIVYSYN